MFRPERSRRRLGGTAFVEMLGKGLLAFLALGAGNLVGAVHARKVPEDNMVEPSAIMPAIFAAVVLTVILLGVASRWPFRPKPWLLGSLIAIIPACYVIRFLDIPGILQTVVSVAGLVSGSALAWAIGSLQLLEMNA